MKIITPKKGIKIVRFFGGIILCGIAIFFLVINDLYAKAFAIMLLKEGGIQITKSKMLDLTLGEKTKIRNLFQF